MTIKDNRALNEAKEKNMAQCRKLDCSLNGCVCEESTSVDPVVIGLRYESLQVVTDWAAKIAIQILEKQGSIDLLFFEHDGNRIGKSVDPNGPSGEFEMHVSVSKAGRAVPWEVAEQYARVIFPTVRKWQRYDNTGIATHLFESR